MMVLVVPRHHSWVGLMFSPHLLEACMVPSGTMKASPQGGDFQVTSSPGPLCPELEVHGAVNERDLPST